MPARTADGSRGLFRPAVRDLDGTPVPRCTYSNHAFELNARAFYAPKLIQTLGAAGAKYAVIGPPDEIPTSAHIMGTLRMGPDPKTSVFAGLEVVAHFLLSKKPRASVVDVFFRADFELRQEEDLNFYVVGVRYLLDAL